MRRERLARAKAQLEEKDLGAVILLTGENVHAVVEALQSAHLSAAGLDVFEAKPSPQELLDAAPNPIATPHTTFYSVESIRESQTKAANAIVDVLCGREPAYRVV